MPDISDKSRADAASPIGSSDIDTKLGPKNLQRLEAVAFERFRKFVEHLAFLVALKQILHCIREVQDLQETVCTSQCLLSKISTPEPCSL